MAVDPWAVVWKWVGVEEVRVLRANVAHGAAAGSRCSIVIQGVVTCSRGSGQTWQLQASEARGLRSNEE